jgi:hypothetical protein
MNENPKSCPLELLDFCGRELEAIRLQIDQSLEHLSMRETLAALGASDGLEKRLAFACCVLQLFARLYPNPSQSQRPLPLNE